MTTSEPTSGHTCAVCGKPEQEEDCPSCHGSGDDPDLATDENGRYYQPACWVCDGQGTVWHCPDEHDDAHQDAYNRELLQLSAASGEGETR